MLSIAICCYQRSTDLGVLLENLSKMPLNILGVNEVLVVNNGSSNAVSDMVSKFKPDLPLREVIEDELGLANARNKAITEFRNDLIWFLDDDTLITESTIDAYAAALKKYPTCGYFGGPISVDWQNQKPDWLRTENLVLLNGLFGAYDLGGDDFQFQSQTLGPYGANFILRRKLINAVGLFNPKLGVRGNSIARGEELEYFERARTQGFEGRYVADSRVGHRFQIERLSLGYLWRYGIEKGREEVVVHQRSSDKWMLMAGNQLFRGVWQLVSGRRDRFYQCWINMGIARGRYLASQNTTKSATGNSANNSTNSSSNSSSNSTTKGLDQ